jgi:Arc/MetJ-type ribon-helix-helix transcriptional regulator
MKQYQEKINEAGGYEKLSKGIKKLVREVEDTEKAIQELKSELENASEEEIADIEKDIQESEKLLEEVEEDVVRKIESYLKNKDGYDARMKAMREKKNGGVVSEPKAAAPAPKAPAPTPAPVAQTDETVITKSGGSEPQVIKAVVIEEKKEDGFGSMLLWGALGVAGIFIGINLFKNRN